MAMAMLTVAEQHTEAGQQIPRAFIAAVKDGRPSAIEAVRRAAVESFARFRYHTGWFSMSNGWRVDYEVLPSHAEFCVDGVNDNFMAAAAAVHQTRSMLARAAMAEDEFTPKLLADFYRAISDPSRNLRDLFAVAMSTCRCFHHGIPAPLHVAVAYALCRDFEATREPASA